VWGPVCSKPVRPGGPQERYFLTHWQRTWWTSRRLGHGVACCISQAWSDRQTDVLVQLGTWLTQLFVSDIWNRLLRCEQSKALYWIIWWSICVNRINLLLSYDWGIVATLGVVHGEEEEAHIPISTTTLPVRPWERWFHRTILVASMHQSIIFWIIFMLSLLLVSQSQVVWPCCQFACCRLQFK
jgi:hypothetical protein